MYKAADVIRVIDQKVRKATLQAVMNASDDIQSTGRDATRAWRTKVDFKEQLDIDRLMIIALIKPTGRGSKIFTYIDLGTKGPYLIPKFITPGKMLRFQVGYSARTIPVAKYNQGSGQSFGSWVSKAQVTHPGIKARKFLETFMKDLIPRFEVRVQMQIANSLN